MAVNAVAVFDPKSSFNSGGISGMVSVHQCTPQSHTSVHIQLSGFKPGTTHGIHIHAQGDLTQGCKSACDHYNPYGQEHGNSHLYDKARHVGDLCNNITADSQGNVNVIYFDDLVDLSGPYSVMGRSIVIHADPDDLGRYRDEDSERGKLSRTTGNAGARIACAVIGLTNRDLHPK